MVILMEVNNQIKLFYKNFIKYGLDKNNKLNLDEITDKVIDNLSLSKKDKNYYIHNCIKMLSENNFELISFYPLKIKKQD